MRVSMAGASGYVGGELLRLLLGHPELKLASIAAGQQSVGSTVGEMHPHLPELADHVFVAPEADALADADLAFLALPAGESAALAAELLTRGLRVVDLGADHRLANAAAWEQWYGETHPAPNAGWPYGLPELPGTRDALKEADRVAVPGCYATAVTLALAPLLAAGVIDAAGIVVVAASGVSGAGRAAKANLMAGQVIGDVSAYRVGTHQHTPEIEQTLSRLTSSNVRLSFTPMLVPMTRGILATCTAPIVDGVDTTQLRAAMDDAYATEPFVHLFADGQWPHTSATLASNSCHLQVTADSHAGRAVVVAAIDNLGKGAGGQALQCANLMFGLDETSGLATAGVAP